MTAVLVDTSVWVAHFRRADPSLASLLSADRVLCHPLIVVEVACGTPPDPRQRSIGDLQRLRHAVVATPEEVLSLIETDRLYDYGCGAIDMALLASTRLTPDARLWTHDRDLALLAKRLGVGFTTKGEK